MFVGEFLTKRNCCVMCHENKQRYLIQFTMDKDEDGALTVMYELVETNELKAACKDCWKKLGAYITRQTTRSIKPSDKRTQFLTILINNRGSPVPTHKLAEAIYGRKDKYALINTAKLAKGCRNMGYIIENNWGRGYQLISEPEIPVEV